MNYFKKIFVAILLVACIFAVTSCIEDDLSEEQDGYVVKFETNGGSAIADVKVEKGGVVSKPSDPTKNGFDFDGWYQDNKLEVEYDFSSAVESDLTLYAKWNAKFVIYPYGVESSISFVEYSANKQEKDNKRTEFVDLTQVYVVGDDNNWCVKPDVTFISYDESTGEAEPVSIEKWQFEIKLYEIKETGAELIDLDNTTLVESIDFYSCEIDFSEDAINKMMKVEVVPTGLSNKQKEHIGDYTMTFEFKVVDGFNVYHENELAYMENRTSGEDYEAWKAFKEEKGLDTKYCPSSLILHKSLNITEENLPSYYFYQESDLNKSDADYQRALKSLKDKKNIYMREFEENEHFEILGNYFTISIEKIKEVVRENGNITPEGEVISHSTLFRFEGKESATAAMKNLNLIGNAPRVENVIKGGGLIMNKVEGPKFEISNTLSACYFITYMPNYTSSEYLVKDCKAYDSFNCFVYNWGSTNVVLENSEMIGAGGPVIIQDHVDATDADGGVAPNTKVINCNLQSYVTGTEGWFTLVKASALVPQIKAMNAIFAPVQRSFLKSNADNTLQYFNLICVNKSGSAEGITAEKVSGSLAIDSSKFNYGAEDPYLAALLDQTFAAGAPVFQSSAAVVGSGYGFFNGQALIDVMQNPIQDPTNPIFSGDYLCLYYNGMALVFGYFGAGEIYTVE